MNNPKFLLLLVTISMVFGCGRKPDSSVQFPTKTQTRIVLPEDAANVIASYVFRSEDGTYDEKVLVEYRDGVSEQRLFRPDSTIRELRQWHPLEPGSNSKNRQLKRVLLFDGNGKTVLFERVQRNDGTVEINGNRRSDGNFRREFFAEGSSRPNKILVVHPSGVNLLEQLYRPDGSIDKVVDRSKRGYTVTSVFREDGTLEYVISRPLSPYGPVEKSFYDSLGLIELHVRYTSYSVHVQYYENGEVVEERDIMEAGTGKVTTYDKDGNKLVRSYKGKPKSPLWTDISDYKLHSITEYEGESKVKREIELHEDEKTPKVIKYPDGPGTYYKTLYKYFRPDGTLEKQEYKEDYKTIKDVKEFDVEDDIREEIPEQYFERSDRKPPSLLSVMPKYQDMGCENCCGEGCEYCMD